MVTENYTRSSISAALGTKGAEVGLVFPEKCVGCMLCQMRCSLTFTGRVNPARAKLTIDFPITGKNGIRFNDECDDCGICAKVCLYGALKIAS